VSDDRLIAQIMEKVQQYDGIDASAHADQQAIIIMEELMMSDKRLYTVCKHSELSVWSSVET
jgi:hypothetical protein